MILLITICLAALGYQLVAIAATIKHLSRRDQQTGHTPPISILKPVHGLDPGFLDALRSHASQQYPEFEILFGVSDPDDAAIPAIESLQREFPAVPIQLIRAPRSGGNAKTGVLAELARRARHPVLLVNDSDIRVSPGYLLTIAAPLVDPDVGLVTCLYRAWSESMPGIWEAVGIATDFAPSTLVAPFVGVKEFGLGSTLLFRAADLKAIGGFAAIADYLADDYQLAKRITQLGKRVQLSRLVVETGLQGDSWRGVWDHQVRWHRTIRVSRGAYAGLPVTHATLWAVAAALAGMWWMSLALLAARMTMGLLAGIGVLQCPLVKRWFWIIPARDLWGSAVWAAGLFGNTVRWRDQVLELDSEGRIIHIGSR